MSDPSVSVSRVFSGRTYVGCHRVRRSQGLEKVGYPLKGVPCAGYTGPVSRDDRGRVRRDVYGLD